MVLGVDESAKQEPGYGVGAWVNAQKAKCCKHEKTRERKARESSVLLL
jgi:hypothetical protein